MKRRVFTILCAGSLLLCVAAVGLWVRSHGGGDAMRFGEPPADYCLESHKGTLSARQVTHHRIPQELRTPQQLMVWHDKVNQEHRSGRLLGFTYAFGPFVFGKYGRETPLSGGNYYYDTVRMVGVPYWFIVGASGVLPTWWALTRWRRWMLTGQRRRLGLCLHCGYDLRASRERCPECGTPVHRGHVPRYLGGSEC